MIILKQGDEGTFVEWIQQALEIKDDGFFDKETTKAVKKFQSNQKINADGVVGQVTANLLNLNLAAYRWNGDDKKITWILPSSSFGLSGYNVERGGADQFGTRKIIQKLMELGYEYKKQTGSSIQVGDISRLGGGKFPPHSSHKYGNAIDIRPIRKDRFALPVDCRNAEYDTIATTDLVFMIKKLFSNTVILFNDTALTRAGLTKAHAGHYNHLHIQF